MANDPVDLSAGLQSTPPSSDAGDIDLSAGLKPAAAAPAAQAPTPAPAASSDIDLSAGLPAISPENHDMLSRLKEAVESDAHGLKEMVTGPGTFFGTDSGPGTHLSDIIHQSPSESFEKGKQGLKTLLNTSLIIPSNAFTPEEQAKNPKMAAVARGLSSVIQGLTTPSSLALLAATGGLEKMPEFVGLSFEAIPVLAEYAPKAVVASKATLATMGAVFTAQQIKQAAHDIPDIVAAIAVGDTNKALELSTRALVNGGFGVYGAHATVNGVRKYVNEASEVSALKHEDSSAVVRDRLVDLQVAQGQKKQLADLALKNIPKTADREWTTEFIEAGGDRAKLAKRQAETKAGPTPSQAIDAAQGAQVPLEDATKPEVKFEHNSDQGVNRVIAKSGDAEAGRLNWKQTGDTASVLGSQLDPAFRGQGHGQAMYLQAADAARAAGATKLTSDLEGTTSMDAARVWDKLKADGYPVKKIDSKPGSPGYEMDLTKPNYKLPGDKLGIEFRGVQEGIEGAHPGLAIYQDPVSGTSIAVRLDEWTPEKLAEHLDAARERMGVSKQTPTIKPADVKPGSHPSPTADSAAIEEEPGSGDTSPEGEIAARESEALQDALATAKHNAAQRVPTPEERQKMIDQQDPTVVVSKKHQEYIDYRNKVVGRIKTELQKYGLLPKGEVRSNFVLHDYGFDHATNSTMHRLHDTYHDAQQAGLVPSNKDIGALDSDYVGNAGRKIADAKTIMGLKKGRTNEGAPLAASGGFVEGQKVSTEGPQSSILSEKEIQKLKKDGKFVKLVKSGRIQQDPTTKDFSWDVSDYKPIGLFETRPIGPTPIPPRTLAEMEANGSLDTLQKKGLIYKNDKGKWFNQENLHARVPLYAHPDIADYYNDVVLGTTTEPTSAFGRFGKGYDDLTGNMKSLLLSWSPFHKVTITNRLIEAMGLTRGSKLAAKSILGFAPDIDYFNLTPEQEAAIRDGIIVANPLGFSKSNIEEGLSAGNENSWGGKSYKLFNKALEKIGVPEDIRNAINPQKILTESVFGPNGQITHAKFALYDKLKPEIAQVMKHDNPSWSDARVQVEAGREAAKFANNKFGGFNNVLAGRSLQDQKWLRRVLLAPDFLETTGRSILDLTSPYGKTLATKMIQFQIGTALTAGAINYAIHHNDTDHSIKGVIEAAHLEHPFSVVSPDGKTQYRLRTTMGDFMHMVSKPRDFIAGRINPAIRAVQELAEKRNPYGRRETLGEALTVIPKSMLPIGAQGLIPGLGPGSITEPSKADMFLKSIGIGGTPIRSDAEDLAIQKVSEKMEGQEALQGQALVRQQLKLKAEDRLRDANKIIDPDQKKTALEAAKNDIENLVNRKLLSPDERRKIIVDAQGTRLKSIFNSLTPTDALEVWGQASNAEKKELGVAMRAKYARWMENLGKRGLNINTMMPEDRDVYNQFRTASTELSDIESRPQPPPKPKVQEKAAAPAAQESPTPEIDLSAGLSPAAVQPPKAPEVYKTGDYTPIVDKAAAKYGVDPDLVAEVLHQESLGDPKAASKKGAQGLMQLEPGTAKQYGVKNINDPEENIDAGTHYLSDLLRRYDGDVPKALAAYNAGPTAVDDHNGVPPFKETKDYISRITNRVQARKENP